MRSGDYVGTAAGVWTVAFVGELSAMCPELKLGNHAFLIRPLAADCFDDLQYTFQHEDEIYMGWRAGPVFKPGQIVVFERERLFVYRAEPMFIVVMRQDGSFTSCWRWQLSLLMQRRKHISFEHADLLPAEAGAI